MTAISTAQPIMSGLVEVPKSEAALLFESGYLLIQMRRYQEAAELFDGLCHLLPKSDVPCVGLSSVYFAEGKMEEAQKAAELGISRNPKSALSYAHLGEVFLFREMSDEADEALKKAISIDPRSLSAKFAKELLVAKESKDFKKLFDQ